MTKMIDYINMRCTSFCIRNGERIVNHSFTETNKNPVTLLSIDRNDLTCVLEMLYGIMNFIYVIYVIGVLHNIICIINSERYI